MNSVENIVKVFLEKHTPIILLYLQLRISKLFFDSAAFVKSSCQRVGEVTAMLFDETSWVRCQRHISKVTTKNTRSAVLDDWLYLFDTHVGLEVMRSGENRARQAKQRRAGETARMNEREGGKLWHRGPKDRFTRQERIQREKDRL